MLSGSGGGLNEHRAALIAARGYAALALAYFNYEDLPKVLIEIPLEYFETAIHWLQARPTIDADRIAVMGGSRGGELSLLLGATFPAVKAVVAYVPSGYLWAGIGTPDDNGKGAWTHHGKTLPHIPQAEALRVKPPTGESNFDAPTSLTPIFLASLAALPETSAVTIPVEKINGAVLLISGDDDQMSPSTPMSETVIERLREHNFPHPFQHLRYPDAGHLILTPYIPTTITATGHPLRKSYFAYGGTPQGGAFANADSWANLFRFLDENLKA
jgi:dienelactone hydrolase